MNVNDLLKKMHKDQMNDKKVIYLIGGYYRYFSEFGFYKSFPFLNKFDLTNEEVLEDTQKFLGFVDTCYKADKPSVWLPVQFTNNPYVYAFYNNCILAGQLGVTDVPYITQEVKSYYICKDGTVIYQMDSETGLISAENIDSVSDKLSEDFSKLIDIEIQNNKKEKESL